MERDTMAQRRRKLVAADLFCGAGGFTTGAIASGHVDVALAINHWRTAIYSHQDNHPGVKHLCARIEHVNPRHDAAVPERLDLLMASPECTHHSIARGGRPVSDQTRQQPFALLDWIDAKRPRWVLVENVREFRDWGPLRNEGTEAKPRWRPDPKRKGETYRAWIKAIESLGYCVDSQLLNAADFGAPTKRIRLFVLCRLGSCKLEMPWPAPSHLGHWVAAHTIIDWTKPCPSIFARRRPLADKTLRRIEIGLRKFVGDAAEPFLVRLRNHQNASSIGDPLSTVTTSGAHDALAVPFQLKAMGRCAGLTKPITDPLPTIVAARENHALVSAFLVPNFGERLGQGPRTHSLSDPLPTVTGHGAGAVAMPFFLPRQGYYDCHRDKPGKGVDEPLPVVTANHGPGNLVMPFLTKYYGTGGVQSIADPLDTVTTKDRFGLAMASLLATMRELSVVDIGFRMLDVDELARAQGFPAGYLLHGTKAEQVRQVGNAVCPPVAEALCRAIGGAA